MSTIDLHGYTVHDAWEEFTDFIQEEAKDDNRKYSIVITGHGAIKEELVRWCDNHSFIREDTLLDRGAGYKISFYNNRNK